MKKIAYICSLITLLTACYKDKGDYDYHFESLNEIQSVTFTPETYEGIEGLTIDLQQPLTEDEIQRVSIELTQSLANNIDDLDFTWVRSYTKDKKGVKDTITTKGYVDVALPAGEPIKYSILLEIKDRTTTLAHYTKFTVQTRPIFKNSLFLLHGNTPGDYKLGNIEIIGKQAKVREDAYKTVFPDVPDNPFGYAVGLGYTTYINFNMSTGGFRESYNLCVFNQDGTGTIYDPFGLKEKFQPGYVFQQGQNPPFIYDRLLAAGDNSSDSYYQCVLSRGGRFYVAKSFMSYHIPGRYASDPLHQTDYKVTAAAITEKHYVLWDEKNNRFLYTSKFNYFGQNESTARTSAYLTNPVLDAGVSFDNLAPEISPVGKQAVYAYIQYRENYPDSHPFFLFRDRSSGKYYLYELTPTADEKDKDKDDEVESAYTITGKELIGFDPANNLSTIMYNSWYSTNYLFYANEGNVYRYDVSNGDRVAMYSAPSGYAISAMKFRTQDSGLLNGDLGRWLSIGMNKGTEGAVAEILLTTSADPDETVSPSFHTGFENIIDLQFAHIYYYQSLNQ